MIANTATMIRASIRWLRRRQAFVVDAPSKDDGDVLYDFLFKVRNGSGLTLAEELEARGYGLPTLKLSCDRVSGLSGAPVSVQKTCGWCGGIGASPGCCSRCGRRKV